MKGSSSEFSFYNGAQGWGSHMYWVVSNVRGATAASFVDIDEDFWNSIQGLPFQSMSKKIKEIPWDDYTSQHFFFFFAELR